MSGCSKLVWCQILTEQTVTVAVCQEITSVLICLLRKCVGMMRIFVQLCNCAQVAVETGTRCPARNGLGDSKVNVRSPTKHPATRKTKKKEKNKKKQMDVVTFSSSSASHRHPMKHFTTPPPLVTHCWRPMKGGACSSANLSPSNGLIK